MKEANISMESWGKGTLWQIYSLKEDGTASGYQAFVYSLIDYQRPNPRSRMPSSIIKSKYYRFYLPYPFLFRIFGFFCLDS